MSRLPILLVLNPTCLDVVESQRPWIESQGVDLHADQANRSLTIEQTGEALKRCDGVILPSAIRHLPSVEQMAAASRLRVCAIAASGFEWLDVEAATKNGIIVTFAPGREGAEVVADMAWGMMLAVARQIPYHNQLLMRGDESRGMGSSVFGKTLGIIGLGNIGRRVARRAKGFDMRVLATELYPDQNFVREEGIQLVPQDELLANSDFVSLHTRLDDSTRHMLGPRELALMKPTAILVNTARRELVDEAALVAAIESGRLGGAGLDDPPGAAATKLLGRHNVVFTPHLGNRAIEGVQGVFKSAVQSAVAVFRGERPEFVVNPKVYESGTRAERQSLARPIL
ncbi:MAG: NAD(P)-dependent oxidoreductase [Tepidisphaeraceae bacterium]